MSGLQPMTSDETRPAPTDADNFDYWYQLIPERTAGDFYEVGERAMQGMRQSGTGPPFIRLSARCIRYRRIDLREHAEARLRISTSETEPAPEASA